MKYFNLKNILILLLCAVLFLFIKKAVAAPVPQITFPDINIGGEVAKGPQAVAMPLQILFLITILTVAPYILIMTTAFIRITIVLSFIRSALGTQQVPSTQILIGLALFLTLYVMMPVGSRMNTEALQPFLKGQINQTQAFEKAMIPLREFMMSQCRENDLLLFANMAKLDTKKIEKPEQIPMYVVTPAFITSEITTAFQIGFLIFLPFLIIDMIVASVLMSMGMFMLSPMAISLPFKLLLFVMIDGWQLLVKSLVESFNR
ncbi:MAG: flagellar type III secretion system pore protein FliP [Armatimonadota bacterium]